MVKIRIHKKHPVVSGGGCDSIIAALLLEAVFGDPMVVASLIDNHGSSYLGIA